MGSLFFLKFRKLLLIAVWFPIPPPILFVAELLHQTPFTHLFDCIDNKSLRKTEEVGLKRGIES
jgi:hypothetical protein